MICAADIRYCTSDAWFQIKEIDLGKLQSHFLASEFTRKYGSKKSTLGQGHEYVTELEGKGHYRLQKILKGHQAWEKLRKYEENRPKGVKFRTSYFFS